MSETILVVEDEQPISDLIRYNLEKDGFRVECEANGSAVMGRLRAGAPDAIVLDLMLPGKNGIDVLREMRAALAYRSLPVLILTARSTEADTLLGFESGADDYLTKPFSPRELVARVRALLRRAQAPPPSRLLTSGPLTIDLASHEALLHGEDMTLTRREFSLLAYFVHNAGRVLSRDELLREVWGYESAGETRTVDVHVRRLRAKLGEESGRLETLLRVGYRFIA